MSIQIIRTFIILRTVEYLAFVGCPGGNSNQTFTPQLVQLFKQLIMYSPGALLSGLSNTGCESTLRGNLRADKTPDSRKNGHRNISVGEFLSNF
jgi:hypothetical protein